MATAAAALKARARREIQHAFFTADAVRPERAIGFTPENGFEQRQFDDYRANRVVHEVAPGRYWLDIPAYDRVIRERHGRVRVALLLVIGALLVVAALGGAMGHIR